MKEWSKELKSQGRWLYVPVLPADLERAFELQCSGQAPSRNQEYERYTCWPDQQARWLYRHARRLRAQIWEALWVHADGEDAEQEKILHMIRSFSEDERKQLLKGLKAELKVYAWDEVDLLIGDPLPPMRYEIELKPAHYLTLCLTPLVHVAITRIDPELGRSIGDALDGPLGGE